MTFSFTVVASILCACLMPSGSQVVNDPVVCAVTVKWIDGVVRLDDLVSGASTTITTTNDNLNCMTRDPSSGIFYFVSSYTDNLYIYDPCSGDTNVTLAGSISGISGTSWGLAYCSDDSALYVVATRNLYSIDLNSFAATLVGNVGSSMQGLECDDNGDLYGVGSGSGLWKINKNNANVTLINGGVPILLYLAYDPNNNNILYGSNFDGDILEINKLTGAYSITTLIDDGTSANTVYRGMIILDQDSCNAVTDCPGCEYGMYDHSDTSNVDLLNEGWSLLTFAELSGSYKDDFIRYYNVNSGLYSLLTWNSTNCCFAYGELTDTRLSMTTGTTGNCNVYPAIGTSAQCNPSGGYAQGTLYNFLSIGFCHNGESYVTSLAENVTFGTTSWCHEGNNPGIWKRCPPTNAPTSVPTAAPTPAPTPAPTTMPTVEPTEQPTEQPTKYPTPAPTDNPTVSPINPTFSPTNAPTPFDCPDLCDSQPCQCDEVGGCEWYHFKTGCTQCDTSRGYFKVRTSGVDAYNYPCSQCQEVFGDECLQCQDGIGCSQCESGYELTYYDGCGLKYCKPIIDPPTKRPTSFPVIGGARYGECPNLCNPLRYACDCDNEVSNCQVCHQGSGCGQCGYGYFRPTYDGKYNCLSCSQFAGVGCQFCRDGQGCGRCYQGYHLETISSCGLKVCELD